MIQLLLLQKLWARKMLKKKKKKKHTTVSSFFKKKKRIHVPIPILCTQVNMTKQYDVRDMMHIMPGNGHTGC